MFEQLLKGDLTFLPQTMFYTIVCLFKQKICNLIGWYLSSFSTIKTLREKVIDKKFSGGLSKLTRNDICAFPQNMVEWNIRFNSPYHISTNSALSILLISFDATI